jgi:hypothetical protein
MVSALKYAGYEIASTFGQGGHSRRHGGAILAETLEWIFSPSGTLPAASFDAELRLPPGAAAPKKLVLITGAAGTYGRILRATWGDRYRVRAVSTGHGLCTLAVCCCCAAAVLLLCSTHIY